MGLLTLTTPKILNLYSIYSFFFFVTLHLHLLFSHSNQSYRSITSIIATNPTQLFSSHSSSSLLHSFNFLTENLVFSDPQIWNMACLVSRTGRELQRYNNMGGRQVVGWVWWLDLFLVLCLVCLPKCFFLFFTWVNLFSIEVAIFW